MEFTQFCQFCGLLFWIFAQSTHRGLSWEGGFAQSAASPLVSVIVRHGPHDGHRRAQAAGQRGPPGRGLPAGPLLLQPGAVRQQGPGPRPRAVLRPAPPLASHPPPCLLHRPRAPEATPAVRPNGGALQFNPELLCFFWLLCVAVRPRGWMGLVEPGSQDRRGRGCHHHPRRCSPSHPACVGEFVLKISKNTQEFNENLFFPPPRGTDHFSGRTIFGGSARAHKFKQIQDLSNPWGPSDNPNLSNPASVCKNGK